MIAFSTTTARPRRWLHAVLLVGGIGALVAFADDDGPVLCPFRACTGLACPGCGLTRSIGHAVRGDLVGSFRLHPLAIPLVALLGLGVLLRRWPDQRVRVERWATPVAIAAGLLLVAVWLVRWNLGLLDPVVRG